MQFACSLGLEFRNRQKSIEFDWVASSVRPLEFQVIVTFVAAHK